MGMFDWVDAPEVTCRCGKTVSGWQSKDGDCTLDHIPASAVDNYYSLCDGCGAWHEFVRRRVPETPFDYSVRYKERPGAK